MVTLLDIKAAQQTIKGVALRTPLLRCGSDDSFFVKPESLQPIGAFKIRGAYNKIASLTDAERKRGVIAHSSGNHAQGVAYAAHALGVKAIIVVPSDIPPVKLEATKSYGPEVVMVGNASADRIAKAEELALQHGYVPVPPYNDEKIIAGQGTIGLEILEDMKDVEMVLVPVSGGGLISGVASAIKQSSSKVKVIGVEPELAADAKESFDTRTLVEWPAAKTTRTISDGLRTQSLGVLNFEHILRFVDGIVTVTEDQIWAAMRVMMAATSLVAEPSGAVTLAAALFHHGKLPACERMVAVLSGGNIEPGVRQQVEAGQAIASA